MVVYFYQIDKVFKIRRALSQQFCDESNWKQAATVLVYILPSFESGFSSISHLVKLETYLLIAKLWFQGNDVDEAEKYVNKAQLIISDKTPLNIQCQFKKQNAYLSELKRKFIDASRKYLDFANLISKNPELNDNSAFNLGEALTKAINCAILADAGQARSIILAILYKDERTNLLPVFGILESVYLDRMVNKEQRIHFSSTLEAHQNAVLANNETICDRAFVQHNILAASRFYNNIALEELGNMLFISTEKTEYIAAQMISEVIKTPYSVYYCLQ